MIKCNTVCIKYNTVLVMSKNSINTKTSKHQLLSNMWENACTLYNDIQAVLYYRAHTNKVSKCLLLVVVIIAYIPFDEYCCRRSSSCRMYSVILFNTDICISSFPFSSVKEVIWALRRKWYIYHIIIHTYTHQYDIAAIK